MEKFILLENKCFRAKGHTFLFLVEDNAIFEIGEKTKAFLEKCPSRKVFTKSVLLEHMNGPLKEREALFKELLSRRIILNSKSNGAGLNGSLNKGLAAIPIQTLVLQVTEACNLACSYCYYSGEGNSKSGGKTMTKSVAKRAVDFLFQECGELNEVTVVFFGGEPLLNRKLIEYLVDYANGKATAGGKKISFAITTNGTLLSDEVIDFLIQNKIGVTISIDGSQEVQDRYRPFPDGRSSYKEMAPGVKRLIELTRGRPVVARATVAGDAQNAQISLKHLLSIGFSEVGLSPVTTSHEPHQLGKDDMAVLLRHFENLSEEFLEFAQKEAFFGFSNLIDLLVVLHEGEVKRYPCGAGLGLFSVAPDGLLYMCQRLIGEKACCMGDVFEGLDTERVLQFRRRAEIENKQSCLQCWMRKLCAGGCYHEALVRNKNMMAPNVHYCKWLKSWTEIGLKTYAALSMNNPMYLEKLSALRGHQPLPDRLYMKAVSC